MLTPETIQKLDSLSTRYELPDITLIRIGYGMLALLLTGFLFFGLYLYYPEYWNTPKYLIGLPGIILVLLLLIYGCYALGIAVPLVLPLFLVPLMLKPYTGQRLGIAVWSIPVLLVAFALDWGGVWLIMQAVAVGIALFLNDGIQTWKHRGKALAAIVLAQAWVWGAAVLAERLPEDLQHTNVLFFLALAAVLSLGQSVLLRFVKI